MIEICKTSPVWSHAGDFAISKIKIQNLYLFIYFVLQALGEN